MRAEKEFRRGEVAYLFHCHWNVSKVIVEKKQERGTDHPTTTSLGLTLKCKSNKAL